MHPVAHCISRPQLDSDTPRRRCSSGTDSPHRRGAVGLSVGLTSALLFSSLSLRRDSCANSSNFGVFYAVGKYCGPANGRNYELNPTDGLDAICAQHDYCIERSAELAHLYPKVDRSGGRERELRLLAVSEVARAMQAEIAPADELGQQQCGAPLGSWRAPSFAPRIAECDLAMLSSLAAGRVICPVGEGLPRSPICARFEHMPVCAGGEADGAAPSWRYRRWGPRGLLCRFAASYIATYERHKVRRSIGYHAYVASRAGADRAERAHNASLAIGQIAELLLLHELKLPPRLLSAVESARRRREALSVVAVVAHGRERWGRRRAEPVAALAAEVGKGGRGRAKRGRRGAAADAAATRDDGAERPSAASYPPRPPPRARPGTRLGRTVKVPLGWLRFCLRAFTGRPRKPPLFGA
mmetsp:Transcript_10677/g.26968  ORF Transcript_10677/g.26968 Transcript_10677/m.26968 type:complete len:413 (+) Transcript_10677:204-1442(+)